MCGEVAMEANEKGHAHKNPSRNWRDPKNNAPPKPDEPVIEKPRPRSPREARRMRVDWEGIVSMHKRPKRNRPGINEQPGPDVPKPSGLHPNTTGEDRY